jgi:DNA polymerase I-like protein with 3'-5' exonuclease and polymerase domains
VPEGTTVILALGTESLKKLQEHKVLAKNRTTTSYRTMPHMLGTTPVLVSYSPEIGEIDHGYYIDLLTDVSLAMRYCLTGKWHPIYGKYRYVKDFSELCHAIEQQHADTGQPVDVAKDLETLGLDPYAEPELGFPGAYIVSMQASHQKGTADVVRFADRMHESQRLSDPAFREQVEFLLRCPYVRLKGANFKYDLHWLWKRGGFTCSTFTFDTTIVGSLLDENRSNALDVHVKLYANTLAGYSDKFDREVDKSRMDKVPPDALLPYAGGDVDGGLQVAEAMKQELLQDKRLTSFYVNVLHPAARAFEWVEQGGVVIDPEAFKELKSDLETEHARLVKEASRIMGGRIVIKHAYNSLIGMGAMNLTKASMLVDFMFTTMGLNLKPKMWTPKPDKDGIKRPSTAMEHLEMFAALPEAKAFVDIIRQDSSVMKTYNTYVVGFLEHLRSDHRFHPSYWLFVGNKEEGEGGAKTGRLSCTGPAFQTVPKHTAWAQRIRRCYPAPPGYVVVERDYGQGELRVVACIANETNMLNVFKSGKDIHADTAAPFAGYTYDALMALEQTDTHKFEETRQLGKAGNFGLVFGMREDGFVAYAKSNYGVELTWEDAHTFRNTFFKKYPRLEVYHRSAIEFAKQYKHVRTPLGRIRHLPLITSPNREVAAKAERQAINSPVQGTLTDMTLWTIALEHKWGLAKIAPCFGACHDSILNYVPEDQVDSIVNQQLDQMESLPFHEVGWSPQVKFVAEAKVGKNWGEVKKFHRKAS